MDDITVQLELLVLKAFSSVLDRLMDTYKDDKKLQPPWYLGKAGKPVAILTKYEINEVQRKPGALKGKIKITDDFDELPPDIAKAFGM